MNSTLKIPKQRMIKSFMLLFCFGFFGASVFSQENDLDSWFAQRKEKVTMNELNMVNVAYRGNQEINEADTESGFNDRQLIKEFEEEKDALEMKEGNTYTFEISDRKDYLILKESNHKIPILKLSKDYKSLVFGNKVLDRSDRVGVDDSDNIFRSSWSALIYKSNSGEDQDTQMQVILGTTQDSNLILIVKNKTSLRDKLRIIESLNNS